MDESLKNKIYELLQQDTFKEIINLYSKKHPILKLKIFCTDDATLIKSFVMGIVFSSVSKIVNDYYSGNIDIITVKEMIKILDDYFNGTKVELL